MLKKIKKTRSRFGLRGRKSQESEVVSWGVLQESKLLLLGLQCGARIQVNLPWSGKQSF